MEPRRREQLRLAFQEPPDQNPVRILLATDAASEGIDLHEHCHRLVNYDIPFNPNKLEQRIGRIDRYGQPETPEVRHFIGKGWEPGRRLLRGRPRVPGTGRGQGRADGGGPRHGQRRPRRGRAEAHARRDHRLRRGERCADQAHEQQAARRRQQRVGAGETPPPRPGRHRRRAEGHAGPRQAPGRHRARAGRRAAAPSVP